MFLRVTNSSGPRPAPVFFSLAVHMTVLSLVALGPRTGAGEKPKAIHQRVFAPNGKRLIWYRFSKKLPEVSPREPMEPSRQVRVEEKHPQRIVSRPPHAVNGKQMAWLPAPDLKLERDLKAPNLMAFEAPKVPAPRAPKLFVPPPERPRASTAPAPLPDAPRVENEAPRVKDPFTALKVPPKKFVPPPQVARRVEAPAPLPDAPRVENEAPRVKDPFTALKVPPKKFVPPPQVAGRTEAPAPLPDAPRIAGAVTPNAALPIPQVRPQPRAFVPPAQAPRPQRAELMPLALAPSVVSPLQPGQAMIVDAVTRLPGRPVKSFTPPAAPAGRPEAAIPLADAPQLRDDPAGGGNLTAVVVGLNPADQRLPVLPDGSRAAQFSAGPRLSPHGGDGGKPDSARVLVPGLMVRDGQKDTAKPDAAKPTLLARSIVAPTSPQNLAEIARSTMARLSPKPPVARVSSSPDSRFDGRIVYTMAIQMANVTSYSGSWLVWFAEREAQPGEPPDLRPPAPLHKVDPIYTPSAMADRVEGKVRLTAVIRRNGHVDSIHLLEGIDSRLDNSAMQALAKWEFEPARRKDEPVDVDAVVEIPFRLAPLEKK